MQNRILIIEDDVNISKLLEMELNFEGYEIATAFDGKDGLQKIKDEKFDLVLLDLMLPKMNGMEVCKRVREFSQIPIIILTAKDEISDKVVGLDYGADDYMTKPFEMEELIARIKANLRRTQVEVKAKIIEFEDLKLDCLAHEVYRDGKLIDLSKKEYELLEYLMINRGIVLTREKLVSEIWGYNYYGTDNVLDLYIKYVRDKVDKKYERKFIHTVRGVGFIFK